MQQKIYLAHINDADEVQSLKQHCEAVAIYTAETMRKVQLYHLGSITGLIHDLGKATDSFNEYLCRAHDGEAVKRGSVNHTFAGVIYIWETYHDKGDGFQRLTAELVAYAAGAHHGLFDCEGMDGIGKGDFAYRLKKDRQEICYEEALQNYFTQVAAPEELAHIFREAVAEVRAAGAMVQGAFERGLLVRLLLSALIDADRRDTAEFMQRQTYEKQVGSRAFWQRNLAFCEEKIAQFPQEGAVQQARAYISDACRQKAESPGGIYQLNVVTGGGKTISALRYSLAHAANYQKDRIIFIIPLLSVLEQNSQVIRKYLQDQEAVAEHHSNAVQMTQQQEICSQTECIVESWNAPIMISTLVQFLNILFADRTTAIRRLQAFCNSVIVIDEVQSLPWKLTTMFIKALNFLAEHCNCTIVLSSATQPCFEQLKNKLQLAPDYEIVPDNPILAQAFTRTHIVDRTTAYGYTVQEIADFADELLQEASSVLVICNTKKTALEIYERAQERGYQVYHLSTSMCMAHRIETVNRIQEILRRNQTTGQKEKLLCVSTQLVEAGVDFSFERVIRLIAGMDNIVQSAGRCNRSFDYGAICPVYILNVQNEPVGPLKEIRERQEATQSLLHAFAAYPEQYDHNLASEKSIAMYYRCLLKPLEKKDTLDYVESFHGMRKTLYGLLNRAANPKTGIFLTQPFQSVGAKFTVFDQQTIDVIVPYGTAGEKLIGDFWSEQTRYDWRQQQYLLRQAAPYTISLFAHQLKELGNKVMHCRFGEDAVYILDESCYDGSDGGVGLVYDGEMESLIF